jgi:hypothetical protein
MQTASLIKSRQSLLIASLIIVYLVFVYWLGPLLVKFEIISEYLVLEIPHFIITVSAVVLGALIDRNLLFRELNSIFSERLKENSDYNTIIIREDLIPMSNRYGIARVHSGLNLGKLIESLESDDRLDMLFTYHPDIDQYLPQLVRLVTEEGVRVRLLLGDAESRAVARRFEYISETEKGFIWHGHEMMDRMKLFYEKFVARVIERDRRFIDGELLEIKTFTMLPDIPLIIISSGNSEGVTGIRRVLQGYYLTRPAVELPFIEWLPRPNGNEEAEDMARLFQSYFDVRWHKGKDLPMIRRKGGEKNGDLARAKDD